MDVDDPKFEVYIMYIYSAQASKRPKGEMIADANQTKLILNLSGAHPKAAYSRI